MYPWEDWLDGGVWMLKPGEDFTIPAKSLRNMAFQAGYRRSVNITTRIAEDGTVYIQATGPR